MVNKYPRQTGSDFHTGRTYTGKYHLTQGRKDKLMS